MKRKNIQQPNPLDLLNNIHNRRSTHQKLEILINASRSRSKRNQRLNTEETLHQQTFRKSSEKNPATQCSLDLRAELKSTPDNKNKSLKQIYCKTLMLSPSSKKKIILTPKAPNEELKHQYNEILNILTLPTGQSLNEMIQSVHSRIQDVVSYFSFDRFVSRLFGRFKQIIGLLLESTLKSSLSKIDHQQKLMAQQYRQILEDNRTLCGRLEEFKIRNIKLQEDIKKLSKKGQECQIDLAEKLEKERQVNQLIYQLRLNGVDIDTFYCKIKYPQLGSQLSQESFTQKNLSQGTF